MEVRPDGKKREGPTGAVKDMTGVGAMMPGGIRKTGTMIPAKTWGTCMMKSWIPPAMSVCGRSSRVKKRTEFQAFFYNRRAGGYSLQEAEIRSGISGWWRSYRKPPFWIISRFPHQSYRPQPDRSGTGPRHQCQGCRAYHHHRTRQLHRPRSRLPVLQGTGSVRHARHPCAVPPVAPLAPDMAGCRRICVTSALSWSVQKQYMKNYHFFRPLVLSYPQWLHE